MTRDTTWVAERSPFPHQLAIATPCQADWQAMAPRETGRFCAQCERVVLDLAFVTRAQAKQRWLEQGEVLPCLRLAVDLDRQPMFVPPPARKWQQGLLVATAALSLGCSGAQSKAEYAPPPLQEHVPQPIPEDPNIPLMFRDNMREIAELLRDAEDFKDYMIAGCRADDKARGKDREVVYGSWRAEVESMKLRFAELTRQMRALPVLENVVAKEAQLAAVREQEERLIELKEKIYNFRAKFLLLGEQPVAPCRR
jgi:hypothetical protein